MKLIYKESKLPVQVNDLVIIDDTNYIILEIPFPSSPASSGKVFLMEALDKLLTCEYYVSVIGAEWIEREDRKWPNLKDS